MSAGTLTAAAVRAGNYAAAHFTAAQGRVLYHQERLFRSTGAGIKAHAHYVELCRQNALGMRVDQFTLSDCWRALRLMERACRDTGMHHFRDISTGWRTL